MAFPERWDRARFERFGSGGGGPPARYEEDYRYTERDRPGLQDVQVQDRIDSSGPRGRYEERDRYVEQDRYTPDRRRRRTDRELFGDVDPREFTNMALMPYEPPPPPRPGLIRRQSSLDTFDRRPVPRYEREDRRVPAYTPVPVPVPVPYASDRYRQVDFEETRGRDYYQPMEYREVEIRREKSVQPSKARSVKSARSSKAKSRRSSSSSESTVREHESFHESRHSDNESINESFSESRRTSGGGRESIHESFHESQHGGNESLSDSITETSKQFKKGKTRMPKRLVAREAIMDLGYPFDEEESFFVLRIALEKEQIDEVMILSQKYMNDQTKTVFKFDETTRVPQIVEPREEIVRTEWINPPSVVSSHRRSHSHSGRRSSRRESRASEEFSEKERSTTIIRAPAPPPPPVYEERRTVVKEEEEEEEDVSISRSRGALVVRDREYRSDREVKDEIARLEAERRALRLERDAEGRRDLALRRDRDDDYQLVEYRGRPAREVLEFRERSPSRSPPRNVTRVEKDRKGRMAFVRSKD